VNNIITVSRYTFLEIFKSRIMTNVALLGIALVILSYTSSEFTYGVPAKVALDFGLGTLSLSLVGIALFMGVNLIAKEIEHRTVYMVLARPISRTNFLIGRLLGMALVLFLNTILLGGMTVSLYFYLGGEPNSLLYPCILFIYLEALIVLLIVVFFSLITNIIMSVIYTICIYFVGHAIDDTLLLPFMKANVGAKKLVELYSVVFPNFSKINIKDYVLYKNELSFEFLSFSTAYVLLYIIMIGLVCSLIFRNKNLD
jgi:ABC-type transport system involved in multi-copper enzyme maturation permease subunit